MAASLCLQDPLESGTRQCRLSSFAQLILHCVVKPHLTTEKHLSCSPLTVRIMLLWPLMHWDLCGLVSSFLLGISLGITRTPGLWKMYRSLLDLRTLYSAHSPCSPCNCCCFPPCLNHWVQKSRAGQAAVQTQSFSSFCQVLRCDVSVNRGHYRPVFMGTVSVGTTINKCKEWIEEVDAKNWVMRKTLKWSDHVLLQLRSSTLAVCTGPSETRFPNYDGGRGSARLLMGVNGAWWC